MRLPGLPTSRDNIRARAEREDWYSEETTGQGGVRRVYEIPARYLSEGASETAQSAPGSHQSTEQGQLGSVVGTITPGGAGVDLETLQMVDAILEETLQKRGLRLKPERRAAVLAFLYDFIVNKNGSKDEIQKLFDIKAG